MPNKTNRVAALDVGSVRIGVALTPLGVSIAQPYGVIENDHNVERKIIDLIQDQMISTLVIGLPLGMHGQETEQTRTVREFANKIKELTTVPIIYQEETLTSVKAEQELSSRGKAYEKGEVDELAACYILEDYLNSRLEANIE
jgi:putative holliday junction resolvase